MTARRPSIADCTGDQHTYRPPRFEILTEAHVGLLDIQGHSRVHTEHDKPFGIEVLVVQAGRTLGHIRAAGRCSVFGCDLRKLSLKR